MKASTERILTTHIGSLQRAADALIITESALYLNHRKTLLDWAAKHRLPTINSTKDCAQDGGILAYGADYGDNCRRSAAYVDKILKGAKPAELPVQQPTG